MRAPWGLAVATSALLLIVSLAPRGASAQTACETQCIAITGGCPSTIVCPGGGFCFGTPAADCIFGTPTADFIFAGAGDDCVCGDAGDDTINGDAGSDRIFAGDGADTVNGGTEVDFIQGDDGNDNLNGDDGDDFIIGGIGNDTASGGEGADTITGNEGDDILEGGPGNDFIEGQGGADILRGDEGIDVLDGGADNDDLFGGDDGDTLRGGDGNDTLQGDGGNDVLEGEEGSDELDGGPGEDELFGGSEADFLNGGDDNDVLFGGDGDDTLNGNDGEDTINGDDGTDIINGGNDNDTLNGGVGPDIINGDDGDDELNGNEDNDRLDGGPGDDELSGDTGTDVCINGNADFSCDLLTNATIDSVVSFLERGSVVVRWTTSSESGTLGFRLFREEDGERVPVHEGLLPGLLDAPQGGVYDLIDEGASANADARYWLVEVEVGGLESHHGPYDVAPVSEGESLIESGHRFGRLAHSYERSGAVDKSGDIEKQSAGDAVGAYFGVEQTGLHVVPASDIAALLAVDTAEVRGWILDGEVSLTESGMPVAWSGGADGESLAFFGRARESLYTTERLYRLEVGDGTSIPEQAAAPGAVTGGLTFVAERHLEENAIPGVLVAQDPNEDYWFWQLITAAEVMPTDAEVTFNLTDVAGGGGMAVRLHGISDEEHSITFELNGSVIGTTEFEGVVPHEVDFSIPDGLLVDGENTLRVFASESSDSMVYLDAADIDYARGYAEATSSFEFGVEQDASLTIEGLEGSAPRVFDVTDPSMPVELVDFAIDGEAVSLALESGRDYFVATDEGILSPTSAWADVASDWRDSQNRAAYVIVTPAPFVDEAEALADYRRIEGLSAEVVELQDIYDEFADGTPDPNSIVDFLRFAHANWEEVPQYVVLLGDGSFDYRDFYGSGGNFVPPLMALTLRGILSADRLYGDLVGDDGRPEVFVGRIPVASELEVDAAIERIIDYEAALDSIDNRAVLFADAKDELSDGDFAELQDSLAVSVGSAWEASSIYRPDFANAESAREAFVEAVRDSPRVINYFGHAGTTALGLNENLFDVEDVESLEVDGVPPIFAMMTCNLSRFAVPSGLLPEGRALGEAMSVDEDVGVAVIGSSGGSVHQQVGTLSAALFDELIAGQETRLGPIVDRALRSLDGTELAREFSTVYHVFGDPALVVSKAASPGPGGSGGTAGSDASGGTDGSGGTVTSPPVPGGGGCSASSPSSARWPWAIALALFLLALRTRKRHV